MAPRTIDGVNPATAQRLAARRADWRVGHVIYQVIVDRFAPSQRLQTKRSHYTGPRRLREWNEKPESMSFLHEAHVNGAEVQFWGGDLDSLRSKVDYLQDLGVDVVYLNPVFEAYTNHKYDAHDYRRIDPQYGTNEELRDLAADLHERGMKIMLDGVFNHMGQRAPAFLAAKASATAPERAHYCLGDEYRHGYRGWRNVANLPELNLEDPAVRAMLYGDEDSVVRHWIRWGGIDGWRLDVAPDLGFQYLGELTDAAHAANPDSVVIGECWNYPEEWLHVLDGIMNMHLRLLLLNLVDGKMSPLAVARSIERMVDDSGIEGLLRSHLVLDNHDVPRIGTIVPDREHQRLLRVLQFTLPGCPVVYYGSELGMEGGHDPSNRGPMQWELATDDNDQLALVRQLIALRAKHPALRVGDFRRLDAEHCLAFARYTEKALESILVFANPLNREVVDVMPVRNSRLMDVAPLECLLTGERVSLHCGMAEVKLPPRSVRVFSALDWDGAGGYSLYKRVP